MRHGASAVVRQRSQLRIRPSDVTSKDSEGPASDIFDEVVAKRSNDAGNIRARRRRIVGDDAVLQTGGTAGSLENSAPTDCCGVAGDRRKIEIDARRDATVVAASAACRDVSTDRGIGHIDYGGPG